MAKKKETQFKGRKGNACTKNKEGKQEGTKVTRRKEREVKNKKKKGGILMHGTGENKKVN